MGYLKCDKCGGYYELKPGESPKDFEKCECGGTLQFVEKLNQKIDEIPTKKVTSPKIKVLSLLVGTLIMLIPYMIFLRNLPTFGNLTSDILWVVAGFITAFSISKTLKNGVLTGFLIAALSGIVALTTFILIFPDELVGMESDIVYNISFIAGRLTLYIIIPAIFSIIGGLIGISAHNKLTKKVGSE